jgi:phosphatidylserine/phosphatidylglycerophosphate/cardiolipin synthase-like enzyme
VLTGFLEDARSSLDIAIYDLALGPTPAGVLRSSLHSLKSRGVVVRMVYNQEQAHRPLLPPPGFVDHDFLRTLAIESRAIPGVPDLMHHKYAVRDGSAVWTGSTNWTNDSWTREENVIVRVEDQRVAAAFRDNFEELWRERSVQRSGHQPPTWWELSGGVRLRAYFTPGRAEKLVHEIAQRIATARRRIAICSPVLTSGPILASLAETIGRAGLEIVGCYDATQMEEVERQWARLPQSSWKLKAWETVRAGIHWGAKRSTPYQAGSVHDFMHAKCVVTDDTVFAGSYNLSHSGEENAENVLEVEDAATADRFAAYVRDVASRYALPLAEQAVDSRPI